jgi:hypothetical protein
LYRLHAVVGAVNNNPNKTVKTKQAPVVADQAAVVNAAVTAAREKARKPRAPRQKPAKSPDEAGKAPKPTVLKLGDIYIYIYIYIYKWDRILAC